MSTQGRKFDAGKPEFSLLPPYALEAVAKVLTVGAQKYDVDNWKYVPNGAYRYKNAAGRHINEYIKGNKFDEETGLNHLAHAICCLMFMLDADESGVPLAGKGKNLPEALTGRYVDNMPKYTFVPSNVSAINDYKDVITTHINLSGTAYPVKFKKD